MRIRECYAEWIRKGIENRFGPEQDLGRIKLRLIVSKWFGPLRQVVIEHAARVYTPEKRTSSTMMELQRKH